MANKVDSYHTVIVIGAGAAGLYAAQQLRQQYPDVLVVEAQNHVGGRIRQVGRCRLKHDV
jgi:monoamine oxidase